jgi:hypothetical protein
MEKDRNGKSKQRRKKKKEGLMFLDPPISAFQMRKEK